MTGGGVAACTLLPMPVCGEPGIGAITADGRLKSRKLKLNFDWRSVGGGASFVQLLFSASGNKLIAIVGPELAR